MRYSYLPYKGDYGREIGMRLAIFPQTAATFVIDFDRHLVAFHVETKADLPALDLLRDIIRVGPDFINVVEYLRQLGYTYAPEEATRAWA